MKIKKKEDVGGCSLSPAADQGVSRRLLPTPPTSEALTPHLAVPRLGQEVQWQATWAVCT